MNDIIMRDCYYILRAMHDGACPKCGFTDTADSFIYREGLRCLGCWFEITGKEKILLEKLTPLVLKRRIDSFENWRESIKK